MLRECIDVDSRKNLKGAYAPSNNTVSNALKKCWWGAPNVPRCIIAAATTPSSVIKVWTKPHQHSCKELSPVLMRFISNCDNSLPFLSSNVFLILLGYYDTVGASNLQAVSFFLDCGSLHYRRPCGISIPNWNTTASEALWLTP